MEHAGDCREYMLVGDRLSPDSVAVMLIAVLATDSLSDVAAQTRDFAEATPGGSRKSFREEVAEILGDVDIARIARIEVFRSQRLCKITIQDFEHVEGELVEANKVVFTARGIIALFPFSRVSVEASFDYPHLIAEDLKVAAETGEAPPPLDEYDEGDSP